MPDLGYLVLGGREKLMEENDDADRDGRASVWLRALSRGNKLAEIRERWQIVLSKKVNGRKR